MLIHLGADGTWQSISLSTEPVGEALPGGWYPGTGGDCRLQLAFPDGTGRADLWLDPARLPSANDRSVRLLISEQACSSGRSPAGRILAPQIAYRLDAVLVVVTIHRLTGGQDCQGGDPTPYSLQMNQPIGSRQLFDASLVPPVVVEKL